VKILVVSNVYPPIVRGGYEVECAGVVEFLRSRGDDVRVLTSSSREVESEEPFICRELPLLPLVKRSHFRAPLAARSGVAVARSQLERFEPDLVYIWNGAQIPHSAIHAFLVSGTPTAFRVCEHWFGGLFTRDLFMCHLDPGHFGLRWPWSLAMRTYNRLSLGLTTSPASPVAISWVSDFLRSAVPIPSRLEVVLERTIRATTQSASEFLSAERTPTQPPLVTFIGRLSHEKGSQIAVNAAGVLARRGRDVDLALVGPASPSDRHRLEHEARQAGIRHRCKLFGVLEPRQLGELLSRSSVLVVPSVWQEPMGIVVVEGALARVPIVASRVGGIPELVTDTEAILVPPGDPTALADAICVVLRDPEAAALRASRAYARARAMSWDAYTESTAAFVDEAFEALSRARSLPR
jgi:glycosyltransferase involved in cell wall biosynthesis